LDKLTNGDNAEDYIAEAVFNLIRETEREDAWRLFRTLVGRLTSPPAHDVERGMAKLLRARPMPPAIDPRPPAAE
jgi:hypothetical protein